MREAIALAFPVPKIGPDSDGSSLFKKYNIRSRPPDILRLLFKFGGSLNTIIRPSMSVHTQKDIVRLILKEKYFLKPELNFKFDPRLKTIFNLEGNFSVKLNLDITKFDMRHFYVIMSTLELENKGLLTKEESRRFIDYSCDQLNLEIKDQYKLKLYGIVKYFNGREVGRTELLIEERELSKLIKYNKLFGRVKFGRGRTSQTPSIDPS
jgi:hypothetical protein